MPQKFKKQHDHPKRQSKKIDKEQQKEVIDKVQQKDKELQILSDKFIQLEQIADKF
ncbi:20606_t:CDS:2 [Racocetra persica]|uniref:20606_t:CDS:1 n=1 Tax=Racocetra persica TaxID=160502 RepID=A0ACA9NAE8_9GLOM|nr:20606_t:CDS:2 [Racocetra persica]